MPAGVAPAHTPTFHTPAVPVSHTFFLWAGATSAATGDWQLATGAWGRDDNSSLQAGLAAAGTPQPGHGGPWRATGAPPPVALQLALLLLKLPILPSMFVAPPPPLLPSPRNDPRPFQHLALPARPSPSTPTSLSPTTPSIFGSCQHHRHLRFNHRPSITPTILSVCESLLQQHSHHMPAARLERRRRPSTKTSVAVSIAIATRSLIP